MFILLFILSKQFVRTRTRSVAGSEREVERDRRRRDAALILDGGGDAESQRVRRIIRYPHEDRDLRAHRGDRSRAGAAGFAGRPCAPRVAEQGHTAPVEEEREETE